MRRLAPRRRERHGVLRGIGGGARRGGARGGHGERRPARRAGVGAILRATRFEISNSQPPPSCPPEHAGSAPPATKSPKRTGRTPRKPARRADDDDDDDDGWGDDASGDGWGDDWGETRIRKVGGGRTRVSNDAQRRRALYAVLARAILPDAPHPAVARRVRQCPPRGAAYRRRRAPRRTAAPGRTSIAVFDDAPDDGGDEDGAHAPVLPASPPSSPTSCARWGRTWA